MGKLDEVPQSGQTAPNLKPKLGLLSGIANIMGVRTGTAFAILLALGMNIGCENNTSCFGVQLSSCGMDDNCNSHCDGASGGCSACEDRP